MLKKTVIFDLDGTLANIDKRLSLAKKSKKIDWSIFFDPKNISLDVPNQPVVKIAQLLYNDGYTIIIFSGRSDRTLEETKIWLKKNNIFYHKLYMRPDKKESWGSSFNDQNLNSIDFRYVPDEILKKKMLDLFVNSNDVFLVVDDRDKVVKMWRDLGFKTFQVAKGNF